MFNIKPEYFQITGHRYDTTYSSYNWGYDYNIGTEFLISGIDCRMLTTEYSINNLHFGIGKTVYNSDGTKVFSNVKKSIDGKTIYWYSSAFGSIFISQDYQLNNSNYTYFWIAIS